MQEEMGQDKSGGVDSVHEATTSPTRDHSAETRWKRRRRKVHLTAVVDAQDDSHPEEHPPPWLSVPSAPEVLPSHTHSLCERSDALSNEAASPPSAVPSVPRFEVSPPVASEETPVSPRCMSENQLCLVPPDRCQMPPQLDGPCLATGTETALQFQQSQGLTAASLYTLRRPMTRSHRHESDERPRFQSGVQGRVLATSVQLHHYDQQYLHPADLYQAIQSAARMPMFLAAVKQQRCCLDLCHARRGAQ
eukprot:symbB.v1.2.022071.t1/scaffold1943.1/size95470/5